MHEPTAWRGRGRRGGCEEEKRCEEEKEERREEGKECLHVSQQESTLTSPRQAVLRSPQWQPTPSLCMKERVPFDTNHICLHSLTVFGAAN